VGGKALNLIYKLGEDFVGSIPYMTPLAKAYSYLFDAPTLPPGIAAMRENSDAIGILRLVGNADRVRSYGSRFDIETAPSGFGVGHPRLPILRKVPSLRNANNPPEVNGEPDGRKIKD
jgi:hypothetical protein